MEGYKEIMLTPIERSWDDANRNIKISGSSKKDAHGRIPLWIAANLGNFGHLMLYLKGAGVDPNSCDNEGEWDLSGGGEEEGRAEASRRVGLAIPPRTKYPTP